LKAIHNPESPRGDRGNGPEARPRGEQGRMYPQTSERPSGQRGGQILVRHHMLNTFLMGPGGSEYVTLETAIAFATRGFTVYIDSPTLDRPEKLKQLIEHYGLRGNEVRNIGLGDPEEKPLLVVNTSGDALSGSSDVLYLHYPAFLDHEIYYPGLRGVFSLAGKTYSLLNSLVFPFIVRRVKVFIANSSFTAGFFKKYYGVNPYVIPPPVNTEDILSQSPLVPEERDNTVLSVTRISPEKHVENSIYLAVKLAKHRSRLRVVIAGSLSKYNRDYYEYLKELAVKYGVDDLVEFKINLPRHELVDLYRRALVYFHPTPREHFGISIVEAMAAGTPTIIPVDSGSWADIALRNRSISLPYAHIDEAASNIRLLLENKTLWRQLSRASISRARELDRRVFHNKLYYTLEPLVIYRMRKDRDPEQ